MRTRKTKKANRNLIGKRLIGFEILHWSDRNEGDTPTIELSYRQGPTPIGMLELSKTVPLLWKITILARFGSETDDITYTTKEPVILQEIENVVEKGRNELITQRNSFPDAVGWKAIVLG